MSEGVKERNRQEDEIMFAAAGHQAFGPQLQLGAECLMPPVVRIKNKRIFPSCASASSAEPNDPCVVRATEGRSEAWIPGTAQRDLPYGIIPSPVQPWRMGMFKQLKNSAQ